MNHPGSSPRFTTTKEKRARGPLSPCDPGQSRNALQPVAAVGGVFDDGVRLHEVRIDGADEARTVRGEALELLRCIEAVKRVPALEVELHHSVDGQAKTDAEHSGRRPRLTRGATGVSALSNSQNVAK